jgi:hypothetical protein
MNHEDLKDMFGIIVLWLHEMQRVFHDRLVNSTDRDIVLNIIREKLSYEFKMIWNVSQFK